MNDKKAKAILLIEKIRLIESEIFQLSAKYGVKSVEELDKKIKKGTLTEKIVGDDVFTLDYLLEEKEKIEQELAKLHIKKSEVWKNLQHLLELPKLSFRI
ncbi:MAG: hypothetical protein HYV39_00130 [Candidatus Levybacteria bacterium]|nr:hypothetical protein [Candidatus Levybacteria bacterium]